MDKKKKKTEPESEIPAEEITTTENEAGESAPTTEVNELETLRQEVSTYKDHYLRATADYQNFKRRSEKEKQDIYRYANEKLLVELLPIVDNIDRALTHAGEGVEGGLADGLKMIRKSLMDTLEKNGVEAIESIGQPFNPELHHAVQMVPSEEHQPQHVVEEYQKGYKLEGKVIRHSMVKVSE